MVELCLTPHWKAMRWFLLTNRNLGQSRSEYFADVSTFVLLVLSLQIFSNAKATARLHKNKCRFNKSCRCRTFFEE